MRPKTLGDAFYFSVPDGICLSNNQQIQHIKGKDIGQLLDILFPRLDGRHTLDEIVCHLPPGKREVIAKLVTLLVNKGFARDLSLDLPHRLTPAEQEAYEGEIAFIRSFVNSAEYRFGCYRQSRILLVGSGLTLTALVHAHIQNGLSKLNVMVTDEDPTDKQRLQEYLTLYSQRDPDQSICQIEQPTWSDLDSVSLALRPFDMVVHISDRPMLARAVLLNRLCLQERKLLAQTLIVGQSAWSGLFCGEKEIGCWECAWRRLQTNVFDPAAYAFEDFTDAAISPFVAAPTAAVIANQLGFELFKYIAEAGPVEMAGHLMETDLETLKSEHHRFQPHPFCEADQQPCIPGIQALREAIELRQGSDKIEQEQFSRDSILLYDSKLGLFSDLDEKDFIQIPLNVAQVTISSLPPHTKQTAPLYSVAVGTDFGTPRRRATQRACEIYAAHLCDPRRLLKGEALFARDHLTLYTRDLKCTCTPEPGELYTWGHLLTTDEICAFPAHLAFPILANQSVQKTSEEMISGVSGVASGMSWAEAIGRGLLAQCKRLTLEEISVAEEPFSQIDLAEISLNETNHRYYQLSKLMRLPLQIYDVTGSTNIPTFAFLFGDKTITYTCHFDVQQALQEGLEQCLQQAQATANKQPAYALPAVSSLPTRLRGSVQLSAPLLAVEEQVFSWPAVQLGLLTTLAGLGYQAIAVPLDHDPALIRVFPYIVRLILVPQNV